VKLIAGKRERQRARHSTAAHPRFTDSERGDLRRTSTISHDVNAAMANRVAATVNTARDIGT
jgi:hypothetical protein